jgi:hypothetical protein
MESFEEILISLGRIDAKLDVLDKVCDRVAALEHWQWWLKGGWAALLAAYLYLCCQTFAR